MYCIYFIRVTIKYLDVFLWFLL